MISVLVYYACYAGSIPPTVLWINGEDYTWHFSYPRREFHAAAHPDEGLVSTNPLLSLDGPPCPKPSSCPQQPDLAQPSPKPGIQFLASSALEKLPHCCSKCSNSPPAEPAHGSKWWLIPGGQIKPLRLTKLLLPLQPQAWGEFVHFWLVPTSSALQTHSHPPTSLLVKPASSWHDFFIPPRGFLHIHPTKPQHIHP